MARSTVAMALAAAVAAISLAGPGPAQTDLITNGQFANGLAGWTVSTSTINNAAGTCSYNAVTAPGTETLTSTPGFTAPAGATTIALSSVSLTADGNKTCVLYQDVAIPAGALSVTISVNSGNKLVGGLFSGDTATFVALYPTTSVPNFNVNTAIGSTRLVVPGTTDVTTLAAQGPTTVNVTGVAGTTVRFAIMNVIQSGGGGLGHFVPGANAILGIGNVHAFLTLLVPTVTGVSPASGPNAGGTPVVITGTNFTGVTAVNFGAIAASFVVNSATQITAIDPAGSAGTVDITVTAVGGTSVTAASDRFTLLAPGPLPLSVPTMTGRGVFALFLGLATLASLRLRRAERIDGT